MWIDQPRDTTYTTAACLDVLTMTRSAYVQVRCAVVPLWSERLPRYVQQIRTVSTKLDSILLTLPDIAWLGSHPW
jgi:hypothetical protein